jgi:hypothetical protein
MESITDFGVIQDTWFVVRCIIGLKPAEGIWDDVCSTRPIDILDVVVLGKVAGMLCYFQVSAFH